MRTQRYTREEGDLFSFLFDWLLELAQTQYNLQQLLAHRDTQFKRRTNKQNQQQQQQLRGGYLSDGQSRAVPLTQIDRQRSRKLQQQCKMLARTRKKTTTQYKTNVRGKQHYGKREQRIAPAKARWCLRRKGRREEQPSIDEERATTTRASPAKKRSASSDNGHQVKT